MLYTLWVTNHVYVLVYIMFEHILIQAEHIYGINFRAPSGYLDYDHLDYSRLYTQFQLSHWSVFKHVPINVLGVRLLKYPRFPDYYRPRTYVRREVMFSQVCVCSGGEGGGGGYLVSVKGKLFDTRFGLIHVQTGKIFFVKGPPPPSIARNCYGYTAGGMRLAFTSLFGGGGIN